MERRAGGESDGSFHLSQLATREFLRKPQPYYGKIINIASMLSFFGGYTVAAYAASKGGVAQVTMAFCNELAADGINVNALAPGYMDTEMNSALTDPENPRFRAITDRIPAGRWGTGEDMKGAVVFLASRASDYINGAVIPCGRRISGPVGCGGERRERSAEGAVNKESTEGAANRAQ